MKTKKIVTNATEQQEPAVEGVTKDETKKTRTPRKASKANKSKKVAKSARKSSDKAAGSRKESKSSKVLDLLRRPDGATLAEIMKATDWQAHSVRGFISGAVGKKMGLKVQSEKNDAGERTYKL